MASFRYFLVAIAFLALVTSASASNTPLPSALIGTGETAVPIWSGSAVGYSAAGGGGSFAGRVDVDPAHPSTTGFSTNFWCVDGQLYAAPGMSALANVFRLDTIATEPHKSQTRYGTIESSSQAVPEHWTNDLGVGFDAASVRYAMAAYLITQYDGFSGTINGATRAQQLYNDAVQRAIWAVTNNSIGTSLGQSRGWSAIVGEVNTPNTIAYWVNQAKLHYAEIDPLHWVVVSWAVDADGTLDTGYYTSSSPARQTYLAQLSPEPGFYGALALGFSVLLLVARRARLRHSR